MKRALLAAFALLATVTPALAQTLEYGTGQDSSPYAFLPSIPRGFHPSAYVFRLDDEDGNDHSFEYYLRWNLPPALLGSGAEIGSAYAWVDYDFDFTSFPDPEGPGELVCHRVLMPWSEATLTWSNRPAIGPAFDATSDIVDFGPLACDVTELVQGWIDDPSTHHGIALTSSLPRVMGFHTFDDGSVGPELKPSLVIEVVPEPAAAASLVTGCLLLIQLERRRARRHNR